MVRGDGFLKGDGSEAHWNHNVSDIGTKPLSQPRLKYLLFKRHAIDAGGDRVGEKEKQEVDEKEMSRGKIQRLVKALEKTIMYVGGLGPVAAERTTISCAR